MPISIEMAFSLAKQFTQTLQESPERYQELISAADGNIDFWKGLTACFSDFPTTNNTVSKTSCRGPENEMNLNTALSKLSDYDIFVLEKLLLENEGNMSSDLFRGGLDLGHYYLKPSIDDKEHFASLIKQQDKFVQEFCQTGGGCNAEEIDRVLKEFMSQIMFLLKG